MTDPIGLPFATNPVMPPTGEGPYGKYSTGILPSHVLRRLIRARREVLRPRNITDAQIQPASIDLRLGAIAYRIRASFLPGRDARVADKLSDMAIHEIRFERRRRSGNGLRLPRAAVGTAGTFVSRFRGRKPEKLDRTGSTSSRD